jgi:hypothetical protein
VHVAHGLATHRERVLEVLRRPAHGAARAPTHVMHTFCLLEASW